MKKITLILVGLLMATSAMAVNLGVANKIDIDMADYGTTCTITNDKNLSRQMADVMITYDTSSSNTITIDVTLDSGVVYRIGSDAVTSATYSDARDLIPLTLKMGESWLISTTETNVNLHISFESL